MATADDKKDLWQEALRQLSVEDRDEINSTEKLESLASLCNAARSKKEECIENGWSIYQKKDGTQVKLRHILEKIAGTADQIIAVDILGAGFDTSVYAAAPWAVVKMLVSGATSNIKVFADLGEDLEAVTDALERFAMVEKLYLDEDTAVRQQIDQKITKLYASILAYLAIAKRYFAAGTLKKIAKGIKDSLTKQHDEMRKSISAAEGDLDKWIKVADARVLHDVQTSLGDVNQKMTRQLAIAEDNLSRRQREKILQWLSTISYMSQHSFARRNLLKESGLWLLNCKEFVEWEDSPDSSVLWLHGSSGTGKTSLVSQVIDYLTAPGAGDQKCPVAYFYCSRTAKPQPADPDMIMGTILKQLANRSNTDEPIRLPVVAEYDKRARGVAADESPVPLHVTESAELSLELCHHSPAYIVIDALDECDELRRHELIKAIDQIASQSQKTVKVFVSSRSDTDVSSHIRKSRLASITVVSERNQQDINRFIESEVDRLHEDGLLLSGHLSKHLRNKTVKRLKLGAQGMFRWVVLSLESLRLCKTVPDYKKRLEGLPEELAKLYDILFDDIRKSGEGALEIAELVLTFVKEGRWKPYIALVVDAARGLSDDDGSDDDSDAGSDDGSDDGSDEGSDDSSDDGNDDGSRSSDDTRLAPQQSKTPIDPTSFDAQAQRVVGICRNLVMFDTKSNTFRFSHPSVDDYLMTLESFRADKMHARLLQRCLAELMRNRWLKIPLRELADGLYAIDNRPWAFFAYAVDMWLDHCYGVAGTQSETDKELSVALCKFLFPETNDFTAKSKLLRAIVANYSAWFSFSSPQLYRATVDQAGALRSNPDLLNIAVSPTILNIVAATGLTSMLDKALPDPSKIDMPRARGKTPLDIACEQNHVEMVKELLVRGADPNTGNHDTLSSLQYAIRSGSLKIAEMLLATGKCAINLACGGSRKQVAETPLMTAVRWRDGEVFDLLLSQPGIYLSKRLLPWFVQRGTGHMLQDFLSRTSIHPNAPCINSLDPEGPLTLPLSLAINAKNRSTIEALLDDERVDPAARDERGYSAYLYAARTSPSSFAVFINHPRVDPNKVVDDRGNTLLHFAITNHKMLHVELLWEHPKVRRDVSNKHGLTPLDIAKEKGYIDITHMSMDAVKVCGRGGYATLSEFVAHEAAVAEARRHLKIREIQKLYG